jgi:hypothetical protein
MHERKDGYLLYTPRVYSQPTWCLPTLMSVLGLRIYHFSLSIETVSHLFFQSPHLADPWPDTGPTPQEFFAEGRGFEPQVGFPVPGPPPLFSFCTFPFMICDTGCWQRTLACELQLHFARVSQCAVRLCTSLQMPTVKLWWLKVRRVRKRGTRDIEGQFFLSSPPLFFPSPHLARPQPPHPPGLTQAQHRRSSLQPQVAFLYQAPHSSDPSHALHSSDSSHECRSSHRPIHPIHRIHRFILFIPAIAFIAAITFIAFILFIVFIPASYQLSHLIQPSHLIHLTNADHCIHTFYSLMRFIPLIAFIAFIDFIDFIEFIPFVAFVLFIPFIAFIQFHSVFIQFSFSFHSVFIQFLPP